VGGLALEAWFRGEALAPNPRLSFQLLGEDDDALVLKADCRNLAGPIGSYALPRCVCLRRRSSRPSCSIRGGAFRTSRSGRRLRRKELREAIGQRISSGCDGCQDVCPFNHRSTFGRRRRRGRACSPALGRIEL
jgi:hypothetical protein